jgi:hypothetical protein
VQNIHAYLHEVAGVRQQILKAFLILNVGEYHYQYSLTLHHIVISLEPYQQTYAYDTGNNLTNLSHQANSGNWQQTLIIHSNNNRGTQTQQSTNDFDVVAGVRQQILKAFLILNVGEYHYQYSLTL